MNLPAILQQLGGVRPCHSCSAQGYGKAPLRDGGHKTWTCTVCHGTGQILDLAPLLARPKELGEVVKELLKQCGKDWSNPVWSDPKQTRVSVVIGPQRASNLVYEVARQLGGTAVVVGPKFEEFVAFRGTHDDRVVALDPSVVKYRLSTSIPPDATVLFVMDRVNQTEMFAVMETAMTSAPKDKPHRFLPYLLTLVSAYDKWEFPDPEETQWKVISLHQEKA